MLGYFLYVLHSVYVVITCKSYHTSHCFCISAFLVLVPLMYVLISLGIFINAYHLVFVVYKATLFYCKSECSKIITIFKLLHFGDQDQTEKIMATHSSIGELQSTQETWQSYVERLEQYFVANDVRTANKKWAVLLSTVVGQTYQLIRNLLAPTKPTEQTFAQIVNAVQKHHHPRPSVAVHRFSFHSRSRRTGENVSTYVAELRKLSEYCNFGNTFNDMLRDRLVCGTANQGIQR